MSEAAKKKFFDVTALKRIFTFVRHYRVQFYSSLVMAVLLAVFAPVRPYLIQLTVDAATGKASHVPSWLNWFIFNTSITNTEKFIVYVTIFQVIFIFIETFNRTLYFNCIFSRQQFLVIANFLRL